MEPNEILVGSARCADRGRSEPGLALQRGVPTVHHRDPLKSVRKNAPARASAFRDSLKVRN